MGEPNNVSPKDLGGGGGGGYYAMCMWRLNPQVMQYGGFTPGQRVFGGAPKMPIVAVGNPNCSDSRFPKNKNIWRRRKILFRRVGNRTRHL